MDNLVGADVVLADGTLVRAGEGDDEDLLWGLAGGGGNFGVVTELRMRLHPVSVVTGGPMLFPLERTERLVRLYRDWMPQQPDDIYAFLALLIVPPEGPFPRSSGGARRARWSGATPRRRTARSGRWRSSVPSNRWSTASGSFPTRRCSRRSTPARHKAGPATSPDCSSRTFPMKPLRCLNPSAPRSRHRSAKATSTRSTVPRHGPSGRAPPGRGATPRSPQMFAAQAAVTGCEDDLRAWSTAFRDALRPFAMPGCYANFLMDEGPAAARACYGSNADRLARLKGRYDPANVFRRNQNIAPVTR